MQTKYTQMPIQIRLFSFQKLRNFLYMSSLEVLTQFSKINAFTGLFEGCFCLGAKEKKCFYYHFYYHNKEEKKRLYFPNLIFLGEKNYLPHHLRPIMQLSNK